MYTEKSPCNFLTKSRNSVPSGTFILLEEHRGQYMPSIFVSELECDQGIFYESSMLSIRNRRYQSDFNWFKKVLEIGDH